MPKRTEWIDGRQPSGCLVTAGGWLKLAWRHSDGTVTRSRAVPPAGIVNSNPETFNDMLVRAGGWASGAWIAAEVPRQHTAPVSRAHVIAARLAGVFGITYVDAVRFPEFSSGDEAQEFVDSNTALDLVAWPISVTPVAWTVRFRHDLPDVPRVVSLELARLFGEAIARDSEAAMRGDDGARERLVVYASRLSNLELRP